MREFGIKEQWSQRSIVLECGGQAALTCATPHAESARYPHQDCFLEVDVELAITTERADDKGWIAFAPEVRATAQGDTEDEAKENLRGLLKRYPDLLEEPRQASDRSVELIRI